MDEGLNRMKSRIGITMNDVINKQCVFYRFINEYIVLVKCGAAHFPPGKLW